MINDMFVIDAVTHPYNHLPSNWADADGGGAITELAYALAANPPDPAYALDREAYLSDWQVDELANLLFRESATDVAVIHPLGSTLPQVLGHEFAGEIIEVGDGVTGLAVGDRAAVRPLYACGECASCRIGADHACLQIGCHGLTSDGGGMAEFTTVDATMLHKLPAEVDLMQGALVEPLAVSWRAIRRSSIQPGQTALVVGAGPIGIGVWFALRARGIDTIVVSETSAARRAAIAGLGADPVIDPSSEDLPAAVASLTDGQDVDVAIEAAGAGPAVEQALQAVRPQGRLVLVALYEKAFDFTPSSIVWTEKEVVGSLAYRPEDFDQVIDAMASGVYDLTGWVETVGLEQVPDAFKRLRDGKAMKVLVESA